MQQFTHGQPCTQVFALLMHACVVQYAGGGYIAQNSNNQATGGAILTKDTDLSNNNYNYQQNSDSGRKLLVK